MDDANYEYRRELPDVGFQEAIERVTGALEAEGFGVFMKFGGETSPEVASGLGSRAYVVLGVCHPQLAHRALSTEGTSGMMRPRSVVISETESGVEVGILRSEELLATRHDEELHLGAREAEARLRHVLETLR